MRYRPVLSRTMPVNCQVPLEALAMLEDFRAMVNRLISWALYNRVNGAWRIRDPNHGWFQKEYGARYAAHYLHSACSVASGMLRSWIKLGGDTSKRPYIKSPFARLDQELVKVERLDKDGLRLRVTLAPRQWIYQEAPVHHKKWQDNSKYKLGELVIVPDGIRLIFQVPDETRKPEKLSGIDLNFNRVVVATEDGQIQKMDIPHIMEVPGRHRKKRQRIQRCLPKNLRKQRKLLAKDKGREHRRVEDLLFELSNEFLSLLVGYGPVWEDLSSTTEECLRDAKGRRYRAKLSS